MKLQLTNCFFLIYIAVVAAKQVKVWWHDAKVWTNENVGPHFCCAMSSAKVWLAWTQDQIQDGWAWLKPKMWEWWLWARPHFQRLGELIIEYCRAAYLWAEANLPVYYQMAADAVVRAADSLTETVNGWMA